MTELRLALDRASVRRIDADGHLHVSRTPISKSNVCGYLGREIPGFQELGLAADKIYNLYRDAGELEKAAASFSGKPLLDGHKPISADDHDHERTVGSVTGVEWDAPYLYAALDIWSGPAIKEIESGKQEQLSSAYRYIPVMESGIAPDGTKYDGRMTQISANHVALVSQGRAGSDVLVLDAKPRSLKEVFPMPKSAVLSRTADMARGALMAYAKPRLAQDAKIDLLPILKGVTSKTILAKAPAIAKAFDAAVRSKLAADADMDQSDVQGIVEEIAEVMKDESDTIAAAVSGPETEADAKDAGANWSDVATFLKGKISDEDLAELKKMFSGDDEGAEDRRKRGRSVVPSATDKEPVVTKAAMDAALAKTRTDAAADGAAAAMKTAREIRDAERFVSPWVGDLAIAMDSAEAVHRAALDVLKVSHDGKHPDALATMIEAQPKPGEKNRPQRLAQDAAVPGVKYDAVTFPNSGRLK